MNNKLFYIANIRLPTEKAHGLQIMKTCEALARQGVEMELIVPRRLNRIKDDPFVFYGVAKNFKITQLWCLDFLGWKFFKRFTFWLETFTFTIVVRLCLLRKKAIYYTRDLLPALVLPSPIFYEIHTVPDVVTEFHHRAWQRAKGIVVISDGIKQALVGQGIESKKILVARDAVDVHQFQIHYSSSECRAKLHLPDHQKIVVYTGHLYEWKGAALLAEAAKRLPKGIHTYIVGGTEADIREFRRTHIAPNLHIVGWQEHARMPYWQKAADLLVLPTSGHKAIGARYTSPLKLFEYIISGTPLVVPRLPAMQEVLSQSEAIFFEPDDDRSLQVAIENFFSGSQKKELIHLSVEQFSWQERAGKIINFVSDLIN